MSTTFRGSSYYSRVVIPTDLRAILDQRELLRSLGTASYRVALGRCRLLEARVAQAFDSIRERGDMTPEQAQAILKKYLDDTLREAEEERLMRPARGIEEALEEEDQDGEPYYGPIVEGLQVEQDQLTEALHLNDFRLVEPIADGLLKDEGLTVDRESVEYRRFCRSLAMACLQASVLNLKRELQSPLEKIEAEQAIMEETGPVAPAPPSRPAASGSVYGVRSEPHRPPSSPPAMTSQRTDPGVLLLSKAIRAYFAHYTDRGKRTNQDKVTVYERFMAILGDRPIASFTKHDLTFYRDTLIRFPRRLPRRLQGRPMAEILAYMDSGEAYIPLSRGSVNADLTDLRHLFAWAIKHDLYDGKNPCDGISYEGVKQESYQPFTDDDLSTIFGSELVLRERDGDQPGRFWLPLILAYTGCRREEVAARLVSDLKQEGEVWYFDIAADAVRGVSIKNKSSKRKVPVHSRLIEAGLLGYVEGIKAKYGANTLLFPLPKKTGGRETVGDAVGKWFKIVLKKEGVTGKYALHSFRGTVISRLHAAGVKSETVRALVGHSGVDVHENVYLKVSLKSLSEAVERLDFKV